MSQWTVEVTVEDGDRPIDVPAELVGELEKAARFTLAGEGAGPVELSVALVSDERITALNREYLSHDGPTDVISFPLEQPGMPLVGDVYVGLEQARRQAEEADVPLREELLRLVVHGTLHVLGWEHPDGGDREGSGMFRRQEEILGEL